jgi:hypothetical protein
MGLSSRFINENFYCVIWVKGKGFVFVYAVIVFSNSLFGQVIKSKSLPHPRFAVIGIDVYDFPKLTGSWNDSISLIKYGIEIDLWMHKNNITKQQIVEFKNENKGEQLNTFFFKSLVEEDKVKFKEVAKLLSYIIIGQKNKMMTEYFKQSNTSKSNRDFVDEVEQTYLIHRVDLNFLMNKIKNEP